MFLASGFAGTTMDAVARSAGVSKASLYQSFPSKDDLYRTVVVDWVDRGTDAMQPHVDALLAAMDLRAALLDLAQTMQAGILSTDVLAMRSLVAAEAGRHPDIAIRYAASSWGRNTAMLAEALAELDARSILTTSAPTTAAQQFTWLCVGQALNQYELTAGAKPVERAELIRTAKAAVDTFLRAHAPR